MAMESITKKRKMAEEKRKFNIQWTEKYFVSELFGNMICLICNDKISVCKDTISNVIMLRNMSQNTRRLMKKKEKRKLKNSQRQLDHNKQVIKNMLLKLEHVQKLVTL